MSELTASQSLAHQLLSLAKTLLFDDSHEATAAVVTYDGALEKLSDVPVLLKQIQNKASSQEQKEVATILAARGGFRDSYNAIVNDTDFDGDIDGFIKPVAQGYLDAASGLLDEFPDALSILTSGEGFDADFGAAHHAALSTVERKYVYPYVKELEVIKKKNLGKKSRTVTSTPLCPLCHMQHTVAWVFPQQMRDDEWDAVKEYLDTLPQEKQDEIFQVRTQTDGRLTYGPKAKRVNLCRTCSDMYEQDAKYFETKIKQSGLDPKKRPEDLVPYQNLMNTLRKERDQRAKESRMPAIQQRIRLQEELLKKDLDEESPEALELAKELGLTDFAKKLQTRMLKQKSLQKYHESKNK